MDKLETIAPGLLSVHIEEGLRGHHLLFDRDAILEAFAVEDRPVSPDDATAIGDALLTICKEPLSVARDAVDALAPDARLQLIRLYFRLLDRAGQDRPARH